MKISEKALEILQGATVTNNSITLRSGQLDRSLYNEVNEVLSRLGGKWHRTSKQHQFPYNPLELLTATLACGDMPPDNPTAFFPTPKQLIDFILNPCLDSHLHIVSWEGARILEPSAGMGAIAQKLQQIKHKDATLHVCEILPINREILKAQGFNVVAEDFLGYTTEQLYDLIVLNPPFSVEGDSTAYITHILHAWELLKDSGYLIAICPAGFLTSGFKKQVDFMDFVCTYGTFEKNSNEAFRESGVLINTVSIFLVKNSPDWKNQPFSGAHNWYCWALSLWEDGSSYKQKEALFTKFSENAYNDQDIRKAVIAYYNPIIYKARTHGEKLVMSEASWDYMVSAFLEDWKEYDDYKRSKLNV